MLLRISEINFEAQIRILPFKNSNGIEQKGTVFKAIAVRASRMHNSENLIDSVQIELDEFNNLIFLINGLSVDFNELLRTSDEPTSLDNMVIYVYDKEIIIKHKQGANTFFFV